MPQAENGDLEVTFGSGLEALSAKLAAKAAKGRKRDTLFEDYMRRRRCSSQAVHWTCMVRICLPGHAWSSVSSSRRTPSFRACMGLR